ncbi:hypothetical protein GWG54_14230 [Natronococcus sp. JC468]|uniref:hypothetical protein n=1 Tax=Natronococcus sp. JC468 TaxID=1961921 RepID=UPI00143BBC72|nr:hypothetical protein [Natronococcus sp. JC468]NKE36958.1 hypothetical protein [Natronococcus sp. JC468]
MSNHSPLSNDSVAPTNPDATGADRYRRRLVRSIKGPARFLAFWTAIVLPFVHVPLLAHGLDDPGAVLAFAVLLGGNAVALYVGHDHNRAPATDG